MEETVKERLLRTISDAIIEGVYPRPFGPQAVPAFVDHGVAVWVYEKPGKIVYLASAFDPDKDQGFKKMEIKTNGVKAQ